MKRFFHFLVLCILIVVFLGLNHKIILQSIGQLLVFDEKPIPSDAVVVLFTDNDWYPRLLEAARLYREKQVKKVVINGGRKSAVLKEIEEKGFTPPCTWYAGASEILNLYGVPKKDVVVISAEDVYDTITEAKTVGNLLKERNFNDLIITTSKYHTHRAAYIWKHLFSDTFIITVVAAKVDPFDSKNWWQDRRQIRNVLAEFGGWLYYFWETYVAGYFTE